MGGSESRPEGADTNRAESGIESTDLHKSIRFADLDIGPAAVDGLVQSVLAQIQDLREANNSLRRDMEILRNNVMALDKKENDHHRDAAEKLAKLQKLVKQVPEPASPSRRALQEDRSGLIMASGKEMPGTMARAARVFCGGPLLDAVQRARIFPDSKTFVDMPLKEDPEIVLEAFARLPEQDKDDPAALREFVNRWFNACGSDMEEWVPPDCDPEPATLMQIQNPEMRSWALGINRLWSILGKKQKPEVAQAPQRHSALVRTYSMMVPGGRFREMYYWDTWWIVRGLLVCEMLVTAKGVVENLVDRAGEIGFVPNGGRIYYLDRSQPPMLTAMVRSVYNVISDKSFLAKALPILETEYNFWMDPKGGRLVELPRVVGAGERQLLNIYRSKRTSPRPESYFEDMETFKEAQPLGRPPEEVYRAISSAAESGWDFSTRWLEDATGRVPLGTANLATMDTCHVIPVDLNSILYDVESTLASFHRELSGEETDASRKYEAAAALRARTMVAWLWSGDSYRDYRLDVGSHSAVAAVSDWALPFWAGLRGPNQSSAAAMVHSLKLSGLMKMCGCSTTSADTGGRTQWDAPNAWPPMMLMLIEGLDKIDGTESLADCLTETWLRANYIAWQRTGYMHEKYDVFEPGRCGAGGEYEPQVGFGWTNGTVLALLVRTPRVNLQKENGHAEEPRVPTRHLFPRCRSSSADALFLEVPHAS